MNLNEISGWLMDIADEIMVDGIPLARLAELREELRHLIHCIALVAERTTEAEG